MRTLAAVLLVGGVVMLSGTARAGETAALAGSGEVRALFERGEAGWNWTAYEDVAAGRTWSIDGPRCSVQLEKDRRFNIGSEGFTSLVQGEGQVVLERELPEAGVAVRQTVSFCADGRTVRFAMSLRALDAPLTVQRAGLLEIRVPGQTLERMGPELVSSPIFGGRIFVGIEHPSAWCQVDNDTISLAQHVYAHVGETWVDLPPAVFGSASDADAALFGDEALRRAFLRYLDTVRVKPADMHVHYNDWWTAPVPSSETFVLENIAALKRGLYDQTGFFFDSYALDAGWSNIHSVWQIDRDHFPEGFDRIRDTLAEVGSRPGLWVSPSSLYPFALDNQWLESAGYEVTPNERLGLNACLAVGGKYQRAFKDAVLNHARDARLAHMKFDGYVPSCDVATHGHPTGRESYLSIAQGLLEVFDALRAQDPGIALEPTCFWYNPSPWWLMHTPFIIGPFGNDSPPGECPCPEWIEAMTTARDIKNLKGREAFLMPSAALQCFDIVVQCPGAFQNHAAMAVGRGRWFVSCYINPKFMEPGEWRFFADLMAWARHNRDFLQEPLPIGGDPVARKAYGYAFRGTDRQLVCARNPWIEEAGLALPAAWTDGVTRQIRMLYPRRETLAAVAPGAPLPAVHLGPYETQFIEIVPVADGAAGGPAAPAQPEVAWREASASGAREVFAAEPAPFGPSWTCTEGDVDQRLAFTAEGTLDVSGILSAELCVLCEGTPDVAACACTLLVDGASAPVQASRSAGAFQAGGPPPEHWSWFTAPISEGTHRVRIEVSLNATEATFGVFLRGTVAAVSEPPYGDGPAFPLYQADRRSWSRVLAPLQRYTPDNTPEQPRTREVVRIDGVYLDTLDWQEATAGWGEVRRNRSVIEQRMTMGGRTYFRGLGTHAPSRIAYDLPKSYATFAATIGYDQEVMGGSISFVVEGDGVELFRSPVFRVDSAPMDVSVPIAGVRRLTLLVEDAGDGVAADHADWADARLLR